MADASAKGVRSLSFNILHSGEKATVEYWAGGNYLPDALGQINHLLRDFRDGEIHVIEPSLLDLLVALRARLETVAPFDVICGYRSPATNAFLRSEYSGVAAKSLHMKGKAVDISIAGRSLKALHEAAVGLRGGGVGYYPQEDFVHHQIDDDLLHRVAKGLAVGVAAEPAGVGSQAQSCNNLRCPIGKRPLGGCLRHGLRRGGRTRRRDHEE